MTKVRVDHLRKELDIPRTGKNNRELNAFYLGAIEGDVRRFFDMSKLTKDQLIEINFLVAMYVAVKDKQICSEGEWGALTHEYQEIFHPDYDWFRKRGLGFAGLFGEDPEQNWDMLVTKLKENA